MADRKNQADLTATEKRNFIDAVLELKRSGRYDEFISTHNAFIIGDTDNGERTGHRSPSFLPWHRRFLLQFEQALQSITPSVMLPYWDWTVDRTSRSSLWADDFLGGDGRSGDGRVTSGAFAFGNGKWPMNIRVDGRTFLRRSLGTGVRELPTRAEVDRVLAMPVYDTAPWNSSSDGFRNNIEGWRGPNLHNRVHVWVGGQMTTGSSPNDPVFWLHHCFIDKLWADWQRLHPKSGYLPTGNTPDVVDLHDTMKPWNDVTPADLLDHTKFYTYA
ncbi:MULTISPECIES: tyrosinase MelC2 [Streptomyces]|uniref:Tyrosinase n=1 Tax=Streptomyces nigrescens TaxID=1920 RepID=A0A640TR07_STRNI|nr:MULTISPECIES: tyrosinase family protein [Streptomyces]MCX5446555.1 tyrosinase family protein [Streptomyces libani]MYX11678.1 tyrosinase family protein [Streptomyces sp. SID8375]WAU00595.1 tyrosinase family protein [Streptomyces libani subsp. libani]GFE26443.1 tyrosinase [Streptomyces libani subsp. libani]GGW07274.1 tyrosinase [Streptomyces libani subsp. libani]